MLRLQSVRFSSRQPPNIYVKMRSALAVKRTCHLGSVTMSRALRIPLGRVADGTDVVELILQ